MKMKKASTIWQPELSEEAIQFTQPDIMLKLVSTIDERGLSHITMISSNRAISKNKIVWGAFTEGSSKKNVVRNPKQGIFYMTANMPFKFLQVKADFLHTTKEGDDLENFNKSELMRYFTYVRVHTAYYNQVKSATEVRDLPLIGIIMGILKDFIGKGGAKTHLDEQRLNVIGYNLFKAPIAVRVISYLDPRDGYPVMIPCIQLQAADHNRLVFPLSALKQDLLQIPPNCNVAVFGMNFDFANQLINGEYIGVHKFRGIKFGLIEIEEIYNSSPPIVGKIYPEIHTIPKVSDFHL
jgi:hypothetical protein